MNPKTTFGTPPEWLLLQPRTFAAMVVLTNWVNRAANGSAKAGGLAPTLGVNRRFSDEGTMPNSSAVSNQTAPRKVRGWKSSGAEDAAHGRVGSWLRKGGGESVGHARLS